MFLLDTNIVSEIVRRVPDANVLARLNQVAAASLHTGAVAVSELRFGAARLAKPASLWARIQRDVIGRFRVLPFTSTDMLAGIPVIPNRRDRVRAYARKGGAIMAPRRFGEAGFVMLSLQPAQTDIGHPTLLANTYSGPWSPRSAVISFR